MSEPADRAPDDSPAPTPEDSREGQRAAEASSTPEEPDIEVEIEAPDAAGREAELEEALAEARSRADDNYDRLVRTAADLENLRKRSRRDVADARLEAQSRVLREILPVVDNLERAMAAASSTAETASIREGVELVLRQFHQTLEKLGVKKVEAAGQPFDPNLHEAVSQQPSAEQPAGTVLEVLQEGYTIGDRLLRAALTVVAVAPPASPEPEAEAEPELATGEEQE